MKFTVNLHMKDDNVISLKNQFVVSINNDKIVISNLESTSLVEQELKNISFLMIKEFHG